MKNGQLNYSQDYFQDVTRLLKKSTEDFVLKSKTNTLEIMIKSAKMAIIYDGQVKMAHLAICAGFSVNGVAKLHTEILKTSGIKRFL